MAAVVPVLWVLAAGLGGCEYSTDADAPRDAASGPASSAGPASNPGPDEGDAPHRQQDYIDALTELLGLPDDSGLPYASGGTASWTADIPAGEYFLTAACVAAPAAELRIQLGDAEPNRITFGCGMGKVIYLDHKGGTMDAKIVPLTDAPHFVSGVRLDPDKAPRGPSAAETTAWAAAELGPEQAGEFRGYPWAGQWHHSGPPPVPGMRTFTFVCEGPVMVDVTVLRPRGEDLFKGSGLPCGRPLSADIPMGPEGVMVMVDSDNSPVQAAYSLLPTAASGQ
jgi:hypothetical protein